MIEDGFDPNDIDGMVERLEILRGRHRELDEMIARLTVESGEGFQVMGLKREKLRIKDQIAWISGRLTPDIIA